MGAPHALDVWCRFRAGECHSAIVLLACCLPTLPNGECGPEKAVTEPPQETCKDLPSTFTSWRSPCWAGSRLFPLHLLSTCPSAWDLACTSPWVPSPSAAGLPSQQDMWCEVDGAEDQVGTFHLASSRVVTMAESFDQKLLSLQQPPPQPASPSGSWDPLPLLVPSSRVAAMLLPAARDLGLLSDLSTPLSSVSLLTTAHLFHAGCTTCCFL